MAEVVEVLRDPRRAQEIIDRAYHEVALNPGNSFQAMVRQVDEAISQVFRPEMAKTRAPYTERGIAAVLEKERRSNQIQTHRRRALAIAKRVAYLAGRYSMKAAAPIIRFIPGRLRRSIRRIASSAGSGLRRPS